MLDRTAQEARLRVVKLETVRLEPEIRAEPLAPKPVPTIPPSVIEPFLSRPLIVGPDGTRFGCRALPPPRKTASAIGAGATAYAAGLTPDKGQVWQIFRRGDPLIDPETSETLGYEAIYLGEARAVKFAEESTLRS